MSNTKNAETMTAAERYRELMKGREMETVDVTAPSGFVFKFRKPSKYGLLFSTYRLPQTAASQAAEAWGEREKDEEGTLSSFSNLGAGEKADFAAAAFNMRDRMLELSVDPKLVIGPAGSPIELSLDDVEPSDITYLFEWFTSGGNAGLMAANFPKGPRPSAMASANRAERRRAAKHSNGHSRP